MNAQRSDKKPLPRFKDELKPLCDKHYQPMTRCCIAGHSAGVDTGVYRFACDKPGCNRQYDITEGYGDKIEGSVVLENIKLMRCGDDENAGYIESYNSASKSETWKCPTRRCERQKVVSQGQAP